MNRRASIRASDADRERVAERLRDAAAEGRILAHELEERLAKALRARTYGELDDVVSDLPGVRVGLPDRRSSRGLAVLRNQPVAVVAVVLAVAAIALLVAAALFVAFSGAWLLIVGFFVLVHRGGRYRGRYRT